MRDFRNPERFLAGSGRRILPYGAPKRGEARGSQRSEPIRTTYHAELDADRNPIFDELPSPKPSAFRDERMAAQRAGALREGGVSQEYLTRGGRGRADIASGSDAGPPTATPPFASYGSEKWDEDVYSPPSLSARRKTPFEKVNYTPHDIPREARKRTHLTDPPLQGQNRLSMRDLRVERDAEFDRLLRDIDGRDSFDGVLPDFVPPNAGLVPVGAESESQSESESELNTVREPFEDGHSRPEPWFDEYEGENKGGLTRAKTISDGIKGAGEWNVRRYGPVYSEIDAFAHARRATHEERYLTTRELNSRLKAIRDERDWLHTDILALNTQREDARWYGEGDKLAETYRKMPKLQERLRDIEAREDNIYRGLCDVGDAQERGIIRAFHRRYRHPKDGGKRIKPRGTGESIRYTPHSPREES